VVALAERADDLAKGWLVAVIEQEPLDRAPSILSADFTRDGRAVCEAVVRALASDVELDRIEANGVARAAELVGARTAEEVSRAVEALRAVVWSAALGALADPDAALVASLAERLAVVCETIRGAALRRALTPHEALDEGVARARQNRTPLSLLLVELEDSERLFAAHGSVGGLASVVRPAAGDAVVVEDGPRAWVIAAGLDRSAGMELAAAVAGAVHDSGSWDGAPLRANVGVATLDVDAVDASGLIDVAEEAAFAAAARGIEITRAVGPEEPA
jgi:hypothetical protein